MDLEPGPSATHPHFGGNKNLKGKKVLLIRLVSQFWPAAITRTILNSICNSDLGDFSFPTSARRGVCEPNDCSWYNKNLQLERRA